jgi:hypothetical protein
MKNKIRTGTVLLLRTRRFVRSAVVRTVFLLAVPFLTSCGGGGGRVSTAPISLSITDKIASIAAGAPAVTLNATVTNDSTNSGVTWTLTVGGAACSPACGSLSGATTTSVTYTPPATAPAAPNNQPTLAATSVRDSTKSDSDTFVVKLLTGTWQSVGNFSTVYSGSFLANAVVDWPPDGSKLLVFSGPASTCVGVPFKVIKIDQAGNMSDATLLLNQTSAAPIHARKIVAGDFNGDGTLDIFAANHGCDQPPFPGEGNNLFLSDGTGYTDQTAGLPKLLNFTHSAAVADLRRTGKPDILVGVLGNTLNPNLDPIYLGPNVANNLYVGPYILRNVGTGAFNYDNLSLPDRLANTFMVTDGASPGRFTASLLVDLDGDGLPDLIVASDQNSMAAGSVYLNDGKGGFKTTEHKLPAGIFGAQNTITVDIVSIDVNHDGKPDLILSQVPNTPVFYGSGKLQVLTNQGNGTFLDETSKYLPNQQPNQRWTQFIRLVDLNGDGCTDIVLQTDFPGPSDVVAYLCSSGSVYQPIERNQLPLSVTSLTPITFPGKSYLASVSVSQGSVSVKIFQLLP